MKQTPGNEEGPACDRRAPRQHQPTQRTDQKTPQADNTAAGCFVALSNVIPFKPKRPRVPKGADRLDYAFGGCPICGTPLLTNADGTGLDIGGMETLSIERSDYGVCHSCKVFWHVGMGNFGATWGEEAERNIQKLDAMRRVEPWFPDRGQSQ